MRVDLLNGTNSLREVEERNVDPDEGVRELGLFLEVLQLHSVLRCHEHRQ